MNTMNLLRGILGVSMFAGVVAAAQAQVWDSIVVTFADCNPASGSVGQPPGSPKSCDTADATAYAETTFTSMKALVRTSGTAPDGLYFAGNIIQDSMVATATDIGLDGKAGVIRFSAAFDGQVSGKTRFSFSAMKPVPLPQYNSFVLEHLALTTNYLGESSIGWLDIDTYAAQNVEATVSWELPVVFGQRVNYLLEMGVEVYGANAQSDFSHTWTLVGLDAFDASGQAVAASFSVGSGAALPTTPVPEPQSLALMLAGLGGLGLLLRRRGRA